MAIVHFVPEETRPPLDARLEELGAAAGALGKPIRIRLQPDIYDYESQRNQKWYGLIWTVELQDIEEGRRLREGLTEFFKKFGESEASQRGLLKWLKNGKARKVAVVAGDSQSGVTAEEPPS